MPVTVLCCVVLLLLCDSRCQRGGFPLRVPRPGTERVPYEGMDAEFHASKEGALLPEVFCHFPRRHSFVAPVKHTRAVFSEAIEV